MAAKQLKASIIIDLGGNVAQKAGQFSNAISRMVQRNSSTIRAFNSDIKALSSNIDKMGSRAIMGATAIGYAFNKSFVSTASMFERFQVQSASLFGGNAGGKKAMDWAKQNAKDTVLSLEEVMQLMTEMKSFGMDPMDGKLNIMENFSAMQGWQPDKLHGAMAQIEQMYSKGKVGGEDLKTLMGYFDVLGELNKATGISRKELMRMATNGKLGRKALDALFSQLDKESKGASAAAMRRWEGLISNVGDDWQQWQQNVMNRGVFDKLKNKARQFKNFVENPDKANAAAHNTAAALNHSIDAATAAADGLWTVFKGIGSTVNTVSTDIGTLAQKLGLADTSAKGAAKSANATLTGIKYLTEGLATAWLGNKAFNMAAPLVKGTWKTGKWGYKTIKGTAKGGFSAGRWSWRKMFGGKRPQVENEIPGSGTGSFPASTDKVMRVFVTNWPASGFSGSDFDGPGGDGKKSRRKKGPGKGRGRFSRVIGAGEEVLEDAEHVAGKKGFWNRTKSLFRGAGRFVTSMPWVANVANRSGQFSDALTALEELSGMSRFKSLFSGAGRLAKAMPWAGAALAAADVATATNNTQRGAAIGGSAGAWIGGALGTLTDEFTGPFGTIVGEQLGQSLGDKLGALLGSLFDDKKDTQTAQQQQPVTGRIDLNLNLPDGVTVGSSVSSFGGFNSINLMTGGYIPS
ncbi:tape measure protein [Salmonella enterica subsp. enterica serovar Poona]|nr:tape measure protein [Salmonella enterica subsp. enterica serovar Poona]ELM0493075.1 tape measure protein [Salmonella enterica]